MASFVELHDPTFLHCSSSVTKLHLKGHHQNLLLRFQIPQRLRYYRLSASRRITNYSQDGGGIIAGPRNWSGAIVGDYDYDDDDDETDGEDEDRSLDLLVRFVQNVFRKISKRARKSVRSVLPISISTKLVGFSVNGVIILAFLWIMKAFLEVVCTLGTVVFLSILLIRGVWSGVSYIQETRIPKTNGFDNENSTWTGAQPAS